MRRVTSQLEGENQETMTTKFKLILGGVLILFGIIFAMQNSTVVEVRFLVWSVQMSQAFVIFLTGAVGTIIGFLFSTAFKISRQSWGQFDSLRPCGVTRDRRHAREDCVQLPFASNPPRPTSYLSGLSETSAWSVRPFSDNRPTCGGENFGKRSGFLIM
jgi:uncharacterized integral membrane protein